MTAHRELSQALLELERLTSSRTTSDGEAFKAAASKALALVPPSKSIRGTSVMAYTQAVRELEESALNGPHYGFSHTLAAIRAASLFSTDGVSFNSALQLGLLRQLRGDPGSDLLGQYDERELTFHRKLVLDAGLASGGTSSNGSYVYEVELMALTPQGWQLLRENDLRVGSIADGKQPEPSVEEPVTRVLWLNANPPSTGSLDLEEEVHRVEAQLLSARYREKVKFMYKPAIRAFDLVHAVSDSKPAIVHFSGHGSDEGILLREDGGGYAVASADWLRQLFSDRGVELVVLNACLSKNQAQAISEVVPRVIGTTKEVTDEAAIRFSQMLYRRLADGESVNRAAHDARLMAEVSGEGNVYIEYGGSALDEPLVR